MKNLKAFLGLIFYFLLSSCVEYKLISRGNIITKTEFGSIDPAPEPGEPSIIDKKIFYTVNNIFISKIETKGDFIIIDNTANARLTEVNRLNVKGGLKGIRREFIGKYYGPDEAAPKSKFTYWDGKPVLQGMSILLKLRPKLDTYALLDSFPSQAETGFSPSLALGWKFSRNRVSLSKDIFGRSVQQLSITPGIFIGTGAVDLTKSNTRAPKILFPRRAPFISRGGFVTFGFNNINIGYAWGKDYALGEGSKGWLYKGENWRGLVFGFDIIK